MDYDGIADAYERHQLAAWQDQLGLAQFDTSDLSFFDSKADIEPADQDGPNADGGRDLPEQAAHGDGIQAFDEYRGYLLDGGREPFAGGHRRLKFARKELLVQVSEMPGIATEANGANAAAMTYTLDDTMDAAASFYADLQKGAGIDMFYVRNEFNLGPRVDYLDGSWRDHAYAFVGPLVRDGVAPPSDEVFGGAYIVLDRRLHLENPERHRYFYGSANESAVLFRHRDFYLEQFIHLVVPNRLGRMEHVENGTRCVVNCQSGNSQARYLGEGLFDWWYQGALSAANGISEEGPWIASPPRALSASEFQEILVYSVAHEIGHLVVREQNGNGWTGGHYDQMGCLMGPHPGLMGIEGVQWLDEEIRRMDLGARASAVRQEDE